MILFTFLIFQNAEIKSIPVSYTGNLIDFLIKLNRKLEKNETMIILLNLKSKFFFLS